MRFGSVWGPYGVILGIYMRFGKYMEIGDPRGSKGVTGVHRGLFIRWEMKENLGSLQCVLILNSL